MTGRHALIASLFLASAADARDALGLFDTWGAFRDPTPLRCYAIATPVAPAKGKWPAFAAIGTWPDKGGRNQVHVRLSRERRADANVVLTIGNQRWTLLAGRYDGWGPSARLDAFIVAKMRSARSMSVTSVDVSGRPFADTYRLQGAATAIDAAALGCVRR